jgi:hypothetical protein
VPARRQRGLSSLPTGHEFSLPIFLQCIIYIRCMYVDRTDTIFLFVGNNFPTIIVIGVGVGYFLFLFLLKGLSRQFESG